MCMARNSGTLGTERARSAAYLILYVLSSFYVRDQTY
jgi:hypothetical protein